MLPIIVSTLIAFLLGITVGFFIGRRKPLEKIILSGRKYRGELKVLHKSEPKTHQQKQVEALDKDKPIIKTFYK